MDSTVCVFRGCLTCGGMKVDVPGAFCGTAAATGIGAAGVITMVPLVLDDVAGLAAVVSTAGALDGMVLVKSSAGCVNTGSVSF